MPAAACGCARHDAEGTQGRAAESLHDSAWPWPSQQVHALRRKQAWIGHQRMRMRAKVRHHAVVSLLQIVANPKPVGLALE